MNFELTAEQKSIQETAAKFAKRELEPVAAELDKTKDRSILSRNLKKMAELGFMGLNISPQYGGSGAGTTAFSLVMTELARACAASTVTATVTNLAAEILQAKGTEEQKNKYIPPLVTGEFEAGSFALTEPEAGSNAAAIKTTAVKDGSEWVLNGRKIFITAAEHAGVFILWAVTDPGASLGSGISAFIIEPQTPGFIIGRDEGKLGQKGVSTNELILEDCRIPAQNLLGDENQGYHIAINELAGGRIGIGSLALGVGLAAMDYASRYAKERIQFGVPIAKHQAIQWMVADNYTRLEAARLLVLQAAFLKDQNKNFTVAASMAKLFASESANKACYDAMQMLGGYGYIEEFPLERYVRDVRLTTIYEGTSEIQRMVIARNYLK